MKWRQFLTPVKSIKPDQARELLAKDDSVAIVDVRQPGEYHESHIPGAKLIPLGELSDRLDELNPEQPTLVYCAIGGRSRAGAQLLAGKGFSQVINLSGGIKAWNGWTGFGDYDQGLELFDGVSGPAEALETAYSMEVALQEFYEEQADQHKADPSKEVFDRLASFEVAHRKVLAVQYLRLTGQDLAQQEIERREGPLEGGVSTREYMDRLGLDSTSDREVLSFAMAVEAQAMDLYTRAAERAEGELQSTLQGLAAQEKDHLLQLGAFLDSLVKG
jgi:rhodanese-related sulfurtransferase/rubrerythrin